MLKKTKENYSPKSVGGSVRDSFQTPRYATELLIQFLPRHINTIWECASGTGMISNVLKQNGLDVYETEVNGNFGYYDFLDDIDEDFVSSLNVAIVTNPPFSMKQKFYRQCLRYEIPFALLIPADWSGWIVEAIRDDGAQIIMPERRIDYITPFIGQLVYKGELTKYIQNNELGMKKKRFGDIPVNIIDKYRNSIPRYDNLEFNEIPEELIAKYSSSDFHSMWLTWGFNLPNQVNFATLTNEMKKVIF